MSEDQQQFQVIDVMKLFQALRDVRTLEGQPLVDVGKGHRVPAPELYDITTLRHQAVHAVLMHHTNGQIFSVQQVGEPVPDLMHDMFEIGYIAGVLKQAGRWGVVEELMAEPLSCAPMSREDFVRILDEKVKEHKDKEEPSAD